MLKSVLKLINLENYNIFSFICCFCCFFFSRVILFSCNMQYLNGLSIAYRTVFHRS